ncbi:bifunctional diguanylate cyclase/phosphodiesterase [Hoeflea sp.]|uniref:bifunctional diguanylate cyclase/phosphodiesterase n=1 Tax=Hoeflea sp. TaxID=1940281 RepID=UPI003B518279
MRNPGHLAAGIALAVACAAGVFADMQNRDVHHQQQRALVGKQLGQVRARLEAEITSGIQLVRGLIAVVKLEPELDQERFGKIAASLLGDEPLLRNIAGAPDMVISLMYPMEGNAAALGLDYREAGPQREAAIRAVETREMVLAGPVNLRQGGQGFIARFPVFLDEEKTPQSLWGIISTVIDVDRFYAAGGLNDPKLGIDLTIAGRDATGEDGPVFFGSDSVLQSDPVTATVSLPGGSWHLAAVPRGGWSAVPPNTWRIRTLILLGGLLVVLPILIAGHYYDRHRADLRELNRRERQLERLSQRLKLALEASKIGVWEVDIDNHKLTWDSRTRELYGIAPDAPEPSVEECVALIHPDDRERTRNGFREAIVSNALHESEFRVVTGDGKVRWIRTIGALCQDSSGRTNLLGVNWDVSQDIELKTRLMDANRDAELRNRELEEARALMEHNSLHDSLTKLPNRRYLDQRLSATVEPGDNPAITALLHIDLDRFKQINDTLGHAAGDAMLAHAALVLRESSRCGDFIARIGGDEFVLAITNEASEADLSALAGRIIDRMREPVPYGMTECRFGVSIGIAFAETGSPDCGKRLLVDADIALYRAKKNGRNRYEFFTPALKAEIVSGKSLSDEILAGLERGEFIPHFQPQFDARTLEVTGVEALARWNHPERGLLAPDAFLKVAEELNVVQMIDRAILEQSLFQQARWAAAGLASPKVSVNVSAGRFNEPGFIESLETLNFRSGALSFELLESVFLDERCEKIAQNIERLKAFGIDIEIDDFGSGYASIVSLLNTRPARLKIDRRLIMPIVECDRQKRLAASIIDIGRSLDISVIAEGVETMAHAAILRDMGCESLQGYALARPMASDLFMDFLGAERPRHIA